MNNTLISRLMSSDFFPHDVEDLELIETHISWIILTGEFAYKIKKPVNFGFLDFTSLNKRKQYCEAELSLNRRSAPEIYCGLVKISGTQESPSLSDDTNDDSDAIEYAIRMKQFESGQLFSELAAKGDIDINWMDELAEKVSAFHNQIEVASDDSNYGDPFQVYAPMVQNFQQINELNSDEDLTQQLKQLEAWTESTFQLLQPFLVRRKKEGKIRNCHGDLHLGNITYFKGQVTVFDCIEFNDDFRWVDVMSDIAFLVMDFEDANLPAFANRFLNHYLENTGDYAGLRLLNFYKVYRAIVRAKISLFTLQDTELPSDKRYKLMQEFKDYINLAESYTGLPNRFVLTMHGISGTGKSTVALRLVDKLGAIRIRSDVERKRLFGMSPNEHPDPETAVKLYSDESTMCTYQALSKLSGEVLDAGTSVIIDATNLKRWQRDRIQDVADTRGVPLCIAYCQASMSVIREWLEKRSEENHDPSDANLDIAQKQILSRDDLTEDEMGHTFVIHADIMEDTNTLAAEIKKKYL